MVSARIYVGGCLVGLVDAKSESEVLKSAQGISNAYPDEVTVLKTQGHKSRVVPPKRGVERVRFDVQRKPRTLEPTAVRRPR